MRTSSAIAILCFTFIIVVVLSAKTKKLVAEMNKTQVDIQ
jgi:hypothetical protein